MSYAGNAKLSQEIQSRILNTFQQTIALVEEGNVQEALLGCDFILRLDPLFEPASKLQDRLQESGTDISVEDLAALVASPLDTELPSLGEETAEDTESTAAEVEAEVEDFELPDLDVEIPTPPIDDLAATFTELFAQREFGQILELAAQNQEGLEADPDLRDMAESAQARLEAEPYVRSFLESSRQAHQEGDLDKAQSLLAKARELDATHADILALESELIPTEEAPPELEVPASELGLTEETTTWLDDSIAEPADAEPASPTFDVDPAPEPVNSEPAASLDTDSEKRIDDLLKEGQVAFEKGEYQSAIDAWSRIFLIDIDHAEASRRIELARKLKAEVERQVEEAFHEGISRFEAGETDAARDAFNKVLEMQSGHVGAIEYLEKMNGGESAAPTDAGVTPIPSLEDLPTAPEPGTEDTLSAEEPIDLVPMPELEMAPRQMPDDATRPAKAPPGKRTFLTIGAAVLVAVLAVGWYLYSRREQVFPNSETEETAGPVERADPLTKATQLHEAGNTALAVAQLRRLAPDHPQHAQAQTLIAQWEERAVESGEAEKVEPTEDELAYQTELIAATRVALRQSENLVALDLLDSAAEITPLEPDDLALRDEIESQLEVLQEPLKLFRQGDWEYALPGLWRLRDEHPGNKDILQLMVACYFNLGVRDLQRGDPVAAFDKFEEALSLAPEDLELQRLAAFASAYKQRPSDLLYRVFVKYHPFR